MCEQVHLQTLPLRVRPGADGAPERPHARVNPHVQVQISDYRKLFGTEFAGERFLAGVGPRVLLSLSV